MADALVELRNEILGLPPEEAFARLQQRASETASNATAMRQNFFAQPFNGLMGVLGVDSIHVTAEEAGMARNIDALLDRVGEYPEIRDRLVIAIQQDPEFLPYIAGGGGAVAGAGMDSASLIGLFDRLTSSEIARGQIIQILDDIADPNITPAQAIERITSGAPEFVQDTIEATPDNAEAFDFLRDAVGLAGEPGEQIRVALDEIGATPSLRSAFMEAARQDDNIENVLEATTDEARMTALQGLIADIDDPAEAFATMRAASTLIAGDNGDTIRGVLDVIGRDPEMRDAFTRAMQQDPAFLPYLISRSQAPGGESAMPFTVEQAESLLANPTNRAMFIDVMNGIAGPQTPEEALGQIESLARAQQLWEAGEIGTLISEGHLSAVISYFLSGTRGTTDNIFGEIGGFWDMLVNGHDNIFEQLLSGVAGAEGMDPELQNGLMGVAQLLSGFLPMMFEGFGTMLAPFGTAISAIGRDAINERTMGPGTQVAAAAAPVVPDDDDDLPDVDSPSMVTPDPARTVVPVGP